MITKQQQLEWLANNLEKWKSGYDYAVVEKTTDGHLYVRWPSVCASGITKNEWRQEREKMQKQHDFDIGSNLKVSVTATSNGFGEMKINTLWHELGEFPPAGTVCEVYENEWVETFIIGMDKEGYCVYTTGNQYVGYDGDNDPSSFRPLHHIPTEREKVIDSVCLAICKNGAHPLEREVIGRMYDAGLLD